VGIIVVTLVEYPRLLVVVLGLPGSEGGRGEPRVGEMVVTLVE